jgi:hypothetical protein
LPRDKSKSSLYTFQRPVKSLRTPAPMRRSQCAMLCFQPPSLNQNLKGHALPVHPVNAILLYEAMTGGLAQPLGCAEAASP